MQTILISGADTGIGKTRVTAALARALAASGANVQIVKPVESGTRDADYPGDAENAAALAGLPATAAVTLRRFAAAINPLDAAAAEGGVLVWDELLADYQRLPVCDWRLVEGAGGLAVPLDPSGGDWADFARAIAADAVVLVVADRLGAINQSRLVLDYARTRGLHAGLWLNQVDGAPPAEVAASTRATLARLGLPLWGELKHGGIEPVRLHLPALVNPVAAVAASATATAEPPPSPTVTLAERVGDRLAERTQAGLRRALRLHVENDAVLNLSGNDYLALAHDPVVAAAAARTAWDEGTSAAASPLITGWRRAHADLSESLCAWHGFAHGLIWSSGYAANGGVLGTLPKPGDLVLADRLIHHSMVAGILRSGARLRRYPHLDLDALERELLAAEPGRTVFVVTESVFSMDGDYPDLRRIAELRRRHGFFWILDEAHALGWYGQTGAGLAEEQGVTADVDVLVGTCGKTLASGGAYTLFQHELWRDTLVNEAGEFIYSTALPPPSAAAARAAVGRVRELAAVGQASWKATSQRLRQSLRDAGWDAPAGDAPIVPIMIGGAARTVALATHLRAAGINVAAVRPPTVPEGTSRLRLSLQRTFDEAAATRLLAALAEGRAVL
jgi:8-amino-7-oxononanoate synthase/dethiobiotin synthase